MNHLSAGRSSTLDPTLLSQITLRYPTPSALHLNLLSNFLYLTLSKILHEWVNLPSSSANSTPSCTIFDLLTIGTGFYLIRITGDVKPPATLAIMTTIDSQPQPFRQLQEDNVFLRKEITHLQERIRSLELRNVQLEQRLCEKEMRLSQVSACHRATPRPCPDQPLR